MGQPLSQDNFIDKLPAPARDRAIDMMIQNAPCRTVSKWLTNNGFRASHNLIARYKRDILPGLLKTAQQIQRVQQLDDCDNALQASVTDITKDILDSKKVHNRLEFLWNEAESSIGETKEALVTCPVTGDVTKRPADLKNRAKLLSVGTKIIETQGKALQMPGFVPPAQQAINTSVQVLIVKPADPAPAPLQIEAGDVIDLDPVQQK